MLAYVAAALGGALGALARWGVAGALPRDPGGWPWATLLVNVTGIPAFLLDRRFLVLGAQPRGVFEQALAPLDKQGLTD